jgi:3-methyladenine DNA glycosylase AlkD
MVQEISLANCQRALKKHVNPSRAVKCPPFFKNSKEDKFLGVGAVAIRKVAREFCSLSLPHVLMLMKSQVHDERSLANAILCLKFRKGNESERTRIFNFYMENRQYIREWNAVDDSAPYIVGAYLLERDKELLYRLAQSERIWCRRIAIVSTWWFIRNRKIDDTLKIAKILLHDREDLIHKAVGWMLREVGKRDLAALKQFLETHHQQMPRTMLRYAIERFPKDERASFLGKRQKLGFHEN